MTETATPVAADVEAKPRSSSLVVGLLLGVMVFPILLAAFWQLWKLPLWLLDKASAPLLVVQGTAIVGAIASVTAAFLCCRLAWRKRP